MFHPQHPAWLPDAPARVDSDAPPASVVLDCGPAGEPGFTHALTVVADLVPEGFCRALEAAPRIEQAVWPGGDRIFVRASMAMRDEVWEIADAVAAALQNPGQRDEKGDMGHASDDGFDALARVAETFDDARPFEPRVAAADAALPDRGAGTWPPVQVDDAGVLDCGTSRSEGFTHVLWVDPALVPADLDQRLAALGDVSATGWEGSELLHVLAHGVDHEALLERARELARA